MPPYRVDRLWPDPASDISLEESVAGFVAPPARSGRPGVAVNMVTSIDGRAQLDGTAEGLGSRADRQLMRHYRAAFDAVLSGAGTLRQTGVWLRVGDQLAARRRAEGRAANPVGVVMAGSDPVPTEGGWYQGDEWRILILGAHNRVQTAPPGTELLRAPTERPAPRWVLDRLAERGIGSVLLEGGPHLNAAFVGDGLVDELYWTVGARLVPAPALPMVAPIGGGKAGEPLPARLTSVVRHDDELFLRYRFDTGD